MQKPNHSEIDVMKTTIKSLHTKLQKKDDQINTLQYKLRLAEKSWKAMQEGSSDKTLKLAEQVRDLERDLSDSQQNNRILRKKLGRAESKLQLLSKGIVKETSTKPPEDDSEGCRHDGSSSLHSELAKKSSRIVRLEHELDQARADFERLCRDGTNSVASSVSSETSSTCPNSFEESLTVGDDGFPVVFSTETCPTDPFDTSSAQRNLLESKSSFADTDGEVFYWD
jgi:predicted RNase H-like nuclease (RuvC/YqgF family)